MKAQLKILTGARAGYTEVFSKAYVGVGRHPQSDLRFDPERDLDVSARHAAIVCKDDRWYVRDLDSRNGTLVNGHRITRDTKLDDTDQIRFGTEGPIVEVRLVPAGTRDGVVARGTPPAAPAVTPGPRRGKMSTTERIRIEVGKQTRTLRAVIIGLFVSLLAVAAVFLFQTRKQAEERARQVAALQARTDSILQSSEQAVQALQGQVEGLAGALESSQGEVQRLRTELTAAQQAGSAQQVERLSGELDSATRALQYQQRAARVDYSTIVDRNQQAVAIIWVEFGPDEVHTATAFAVRPDGTMLTNRHVVAGEDGTRRPTRMAIRFADSRQNWRARLLAVSPDADLAVIKVDIRGGTPAVDLNSNADTLRAGDPVALIGYPLGTDLPMSGEYARTSFWAGSVSKVLDDLVQIDGYGAHGASGSPVFDGNGEVVAVLYGGQEGTGGRIVYAAPVAAALRLLAATDAPTE